MVGFRAAWLPVERVPAGRLHCDLTHLAEGQEIFVRVTAENKAGLSKPLDGDKSIIPKSPYSASLVKKNYLSMPCNNKYSNNPPCPIPCNAQGIKCIVLHVTS